MMRKVNSQGKRIQWTISKRLENIDFADDLCLLSHSSRSTLSGTQLTRNTKLRFFKTNCLLVLLYGSETWKVTVAVCEKMTTVIKRQKWDWIGHTLRNPQGIYKRRRPRISWRRNVESEARAAGKEWIEVKALAQHRIRWRPFANALCFHAEQSCR